MLLRSENRTRIVCEYSHSDKLASNLFARVESFCYCNNFFFPAKQNVILIALFLLFSCFLYFFFVLCKYTDIVYRRGGWVYLPIY